MAQFSVIPPLHVVQSLFSQLTSRPFEHGVQWSEWVDVSSSVYEPFRTYIRVCHQLLLNRLTQQTEEERETNPAAFLRQLLRPHGYIIETTTNGWRLKLKDIDVSSCRKVTEKRTLIWS